MNSRKRKVWIGAFLAVLIGSIAVCYCFGRQHRGWIELLNGATWPDELFTCASNAGPGPWLAFSVVVGVRTVINLGFLVTAVAITIWYFFGPGKARLEELSVERQIEHAQRAMLGRMAAFLERNLPAGTINADLTAKMQQDADQFMRNR